MFHNGPALQKIVSEASQAASPASLREWGDKAFKGDGVAKNARAGALFYYAAARRGDIQAQYRLGALLAHDAGKNPLSVDEGLFWLGEAAKAGDAKASFLWSRHALRYRDDPATNRLILERLEKAADEGFAPAAFLLGSVFLYGQIVSPDESRARSYFKRAESLGSTEARAYLDSPTVWPRESQRESPADNSGESS
ncbi:MAG: hypothetical protein LBO66_03210 [Deltaproteobacteria bacterium]|nr:hypothetical protein [Deltaproteobacteria bacterium]